MGSHIARRGGYRTVGQAKRGGYAIHAPGQPNQFAVTALVPPTGGQQGGNWPVYLTSATAGVYAKGASQGVYVGRYNKADAAISKAAHTACATKLAALLVGLGGQAAHNRMVASHAARKAKGKGK